MSSTLWLKMAAGASLLGLAACSGGGGGGDDGGGGGGTIQSQFGSTFANAFNAGNNTDPLVDPKPGDLPPVSLTTDPIDF